MTPEQGKKTRSWRVSPSFGLCAGRRVNNREETKLFRSFAEVHGEFGRVKLQKLRGFLELDQLYVALRKTALRKSA